MKKVQILGPGCSKCKKLAEQTEIAIRDLGAGYTLEKITDIQEIMKFGILMTPALVVDGKVKFVGKVPSVEEIKALLAD